MNQYHFFTVEKAAQGPTQDITRYLESCGYEVRNCEQNWLYRIWDVDLLVFKGGYMYMVEVKADSYDSPNMFLETVSNDNKGTPGCMLMTKSTHIAYYFSKTRELYIMETPVMQTWLRANMDKYKSISVGTGSKDGSEVWYRSKGILVPKSVMVAQVGADRKII